MMTNWNPGIVGAALAISIISSASAELVSNGSFAGPLGVGPIPGWINSADVIIDDSFPAPGDTRDAEFTADGGTLSQFLATMAGTGYTLSFSVLDESGAALDSFTVSLGTFSVTITGDNAQSYTAMSFLIPGADIAGGDTLGFVASIDPTAGTAWNLDDVSVNATEIPEPGIAPLFIGCAPAGRRHVATPVRSDLGFEGWTVRPLPGLSWRARMTIARIIVSCLWYHLAVRGVRRDDRPTFRWFSGTCWRMVRRSLPGTNPRWRLLLPVGSAPGVPRSENSQRRSYILPRFPTDARRTNHCPR